MSEPPVARRPWTRHWRTALLVVGLGATALVVRDVGAAAMLAAIVGAGAFLPLILALEATWMGMDVFVLRALLGDAAHLAPARAYARSAVAAYAVNVFLPAGRSSAEVTRAALLSPHLGAATVARAAMRMSGVSLLGTTLGALVALGATVSRLGVGHRLAAVLATSALLTGALAGLLLYGGSAPRLWAALSARFAALRAPAPSMTEPGGPTPRLGRAVALSVLARAIQGVLFVVVVRATTGALSPVTGSIAQGISIAGSTFGDAVPQQAGVTEGAFLYFAGALGLAATPAKAVAIALVVRVAQLSLALACVVAGLAWRERRAPRAALGIE